MTRGPRDDGRLVVISGPGGVGKGTVVARLLERRDDLVVSVSATTRSPRPGEVDGRDYHFLSDDDFTRLVEQDGFLEWAEFGGRRYGTPWTSVADALAADATVVLEIDVQGALAVRERRPDATLVFVRPPAVGDDSPLDVLRRRLEGRGTETPARVTERLEIARRELAQAHQFDHVVVNADVDTAVDDVLRILGR